MTTLLSIAVTPAAPSVLIGHTRQLTAIGTYDDASTADVTTSASWASATPGNATVGLHTGLVTGVAEGTSVVGATVGAIEGHTTVSSTAIVSVAVTPASPVILNGHTVQMTALATGVDASVTDITTLASWASATPSHATVGLHTGLVTGVATGTSVVGATLDTIEGHTTVTSGTGYLVALAITPAAPTVLQGQTQALVATGTYQDGSTADLTTSAAWLSSVPSVGTVGAATGLFTAVAGGTSADTVISATIGLIVGSTQVHVSPRVHNFYSEVDVQNFSVWTQVPFGFLADSHAYANVSGVEVQVSFDGVYQHAVLDATSDATGHAALRVYGNMFRPAVWLKRTTGTGGGAKTVRVEAASSTIYGSDLS